MKKSLLFFALVALVLTSCVNEEAIQNDYQGDNTISFGTYIGKQTKATSTTNATFIAFMLYAYRNATTIDWSTLPTTFMNTVVTRTQGGADNSWKTIPVSWPAEGNHVMFYGYFPTQNVVYAAATTTGPTLTVTNSNQPDLLVGKSADITAASAGSNASVPMTFTHAFAKISFNALVSSGLTVNITSINIQGLNTVGTYNFNTGTWSDLGTPANLTTVLSPAATGLTATTATNITASNGPIQTIPQSKSAWALGTFNAATECRLQIIYNLKNNADNSYILGSAAPGYVAAYLPIALNLTKDNAYTITLTFGDGSSGSGGGGYDPTGIPLISSSNIIQFTTTFTDWVDGGTTSSSM